MKQKIESANWKTRQLKTPNQNNKKKKEYLKNEDSLRDLQDKMKHKNIQIIGVPEEEERESKGLRIYLKK